jgi:putative phosphoribosyl transferase
MAVKIQAGANTLDGDLQVPPDAVGLVIFAHGSGSSRFSGRNRAVARTLEASRLATLLLDLLTPGEEAEDRFTGEHRFDIALLGERVIAAADWAAASSDVNRLPIALFGASTGAAAALVAAAGRPALIRAVISRGGRPDLADASLRHVQAPTLLIVGSLDTEVIEMNRRAMAKMVAPVDLVIVPGASHLFEEPGTLEHVASLAGDFCLRHVSGASPQAPKPSSPYVRESY